MISAVRSAKTPRGSHVKWKLDHYIETGQLKKTSDAQFARKGKRATQKAVQPKDSGISPQKALLLLKAKYDSFPFQASDGKALSLSSVQASDLKMKEPKSVQIFHNLMKIRKLARKPIDANLLMTLLGVNRSTIKDPYFVTRDVMQLLEQDDDMARALELCRLASKDAAAVGMNSILEWCLEKHKIELAEKVMATRKKWAIPETPHTAVIYFNGLANCHEWGKLPDTTAASIIARFDACNRKDTPVFNAALKALMKNFTSNQQTAWSFFGRLESQNIRPDIQTFSTFLLGIQRFHKAKVDTVRADSQITASQRSSLLFESQAQVVAAAQIILEKVLEAATPPVPPTKEEAQKDPRLVQDYKAKTRTPPMDIDRHFVTIFLQCLVNPAAGTSSSPSSGSHYAYLQHALGYLNAWVPEISDMSQYARETSLALEVSPDVKRKTDVRVQRSSLVQETLPQAVLGKCEFELNPLVVFPPSPFSQNKGRAIFSDKKKPLVDLTREKWADLHFRYKNKTSQATKTQPFAINKFLLRNYLDILLQLGRPQNFYVAMWTALSRWAGVRDVKLSQIASGPMAIGAIDKTAYARVNLDTLGDATSSYSTADTSIVDINLVEDFIYKIDENFPANPTGFALEVVTALSRPKTNHLLKPRPATYNAVFAMLNRELYRLNDRNRTAGRKRNESRSLHDNTAKHSLTAAQLHEIADNLQVLMESIMVRFNRTSVDTFFVESYNKLVARLYAVTWVDAAPNHKSAVDIHLKLIHSGILMYRPRSLVSASDKRSYAEPILQSMQFVYDKYKHRQDLEDAEKKTMLALRDLFQAQRAADATAFDAAQRKIFTLTETKPAIP